MSLFLGPIHYWLYNKIRWFEAIEKDIAKWAEEKGLPISQWNEEIYIKFGEPTEDKPLEEMIDACNIHGWLQQRITNAELRQAALVTKIINVDPELRQDLMTVFKNQGASAAKEYEKDATTPEAAYNALNDFLLEGMPCDRVNEIVNQDNEECQWETTICLHTPYWEQVGGDVKNFYDLREVWISSFVTTVNPVLQYEKLSSNRQRIAVK